MQHNKKGQIEHLGFAVIVAAMLFFCGMLFIAPIEGTIDSARTGLNCTGVGAAAISDGNKITCLAVDAAIPYIMIVILSLAGGYITSKFIL